MVAVGKRLTASVVGKWLMASIIKESMYEAYVTFLAPDMKCNPCCQLTKRKKKCDFLLFPQRQILGGTLVYPQIYAETRHTPLLCGDSVPTVFFFLKSVCAPPYWKFLDTFQFLTLKSEHTNIILEKLRFVTFILIILVNTVLFKSDIINKF